MRAEFPWIEHTGIGRPQNRLAELADPGWSRACVQVMDVNQLQRLFRPGIAMPPAISQLKQMEFPNAERARRLQDIVIIGNRRMIRESRLWKHQ